MLTVKQAADMSGRTERTIWRMIASGKLEHTKDSTGRVWIPEHTLPERRAETGDPGAIAQLRAEISALRERVIALEHGSRLGPVRVLTRSNETTRVSVRPPAISHNQAGLPASMRGWGRWVEEHGGAKTDGVRDRWHEALTWTSIDEALQGIRQHGYAPQECSRPACGCHKELRGE